jgi:predicted DCC family thiol-disulfide oxidoreductase YuxK
MSPSLYAACEQAVHVITADGRVIKAGRAVMFILEEIGYSCWFVRPFTWPPLVWCTELGYRIVANHRSFFSKFLSSRDFGHDG